MLRKGPSNRASNPGAVGRFFAGAAVAVLVGWGGPPPPAPNPTQPLDERRAVEVILGAFRAEHDRGIGGRTIELPDQKKLKVDVSGSGKKYGVAYVTANERHALGGSIPMPEPGMEDALRVV